jgi:hypothetical protein
VSALLPRADVLGVGVDVAKVPQADMPGISRHQLQERRSCHARTRDEVNFCAFRIVRQVAASIVNCLAVSNLKSTGNGKD